MTAKTDKKVILVGAGYISDVHAAAIRSLDGIALCAVVDPNRSAAQALAKRHHIPSVFSTIEQALAEAEFDSAHVLTPPNLHAALTTTLLRHGKHVLVEKPLAETEAECDALIALAEQQGVTLAVNQNFIFHPVMDRARQHLANHDIGPVKSVSLRYEMPLRQLAAGQFSHWMFRQPVNLLLEQAVHPLSQLLSLFGRPNAPVLAQITQPRQLSNGQPLIQRLDAIGELDIPFHFSFAMGQDFPVWEMQITGEDGCLSLDFVRQQAIVQNRSRFLPALDTAVAACTQASSLLSQGMRQLSDYALSTAGLKNSQDPFFLSMKTSIGQFYQAIATGQPLLHDGVLGRDLVALCHLLASQSQGADLLKTAKPPVHCTAKPDSDQPCDTPFDVLVIGGTGFIGRHVVQHLLKKHDSVGIMARNLQALPAFYHQPAVQLIQGDVCDPVAVDTAVQRATYVINLAHGGASGDWETIQHAMVDSARLIAQACQTHQITRLVHLGSIASLYLGSDRTVIHSDTPPDPAAAQRAHYARAKAMADHLLLHEIKGLDIVVLRPGIVVGQGGLVNHTGVGFFNNNQYFIGWNLGHNPLPFVLASDVASAAVSALTAPGIAGKALNLVGDVRPSAREYVAMISKGLGRPYRYVPQLTFWLFLQELGKWGIKRLSGRKTDVPTLYDLRSRAMNARFDTSIEKRLLNWQPVSDWDCFYQQAILVHQATPAAETEAEVTRGESATPRPVHADKVVSE
ncbi:Gfo/Idh/MocA family oxidoreductase [Photobacterium sp. TLY01]|uniref:Gfo/Idh/MocA family oxidoreductase n=1 Tax=Photobacterium sp. TLY01 TaxID=2907534 RepID=UPI001F207AC3|nr:Gfo/Idh/MocA family oxidoreductase [Photobacterium sp. TLY01]UIP28091.1 Gfo/Idh/MocA family oxidoreductase [Photobacterium sp. TLY01]